MLRWKWKSNLHKAQNYGYMVWPHLWRQAARVWRKSSQRLCSGKWCICQCVSRRACFMVYVHCCLPKVTGYSAVFILKWELVMGCKHHFHVYNSKKCGCYYFYLNSSHDSVQFCVALEIWILPRSFFVMLDKLSKAEDSLLGTVWSYSAWPDWNVWHKKSRVPSTQNYSYRQ